MPWLVEGGLGGVGEGLGVAWVVASGKGLKGLEGIGGGRGVILRHLDWIGTGSYAGMA